MNKLMTVIVLLWLVIPVIAGCQPQSIVNQETPSLSQPVNVTEQPQASTTAGPLTLEITSPAEGRETNWGFTRVRGIVSPASAVVSIADEGYARVEVDGGFESDYIVLDEGKNEIRVTATTGSEEITKTVTVNYSLQLHVSVSLDLEPGKGWFTETPVRIHSRYD
jgi:hypothetical protein